MNGDHYYSDAIMHHHHEIGNCYCWCRPGAGYVVVVVYNLSQHASQCTAAHYTDKVLHSVHNTIYIELYAQYISVSFNCGFVF